jgi:hypothetical protein
MSKLLWIFGSSTSADCTLKSGGVSAIELPVLSRCKTIARTEPAITRVCPASPGTGTIDGSLERIITRSPLPSPIKHCLNRDDRLKFRIAISPIQIIHIGSVMLEERLK